MWPVLLLLLLPAALRSATPPEDSSGLNFVVGFPENIAYYHPTLPQNRIKATALYDGTHVIIYNNWEPLDSFDLSAGETWTHELPPNMETIRGEFSGKRLRVSSNKKVIVQAIHRRSNSIQTTLATPTDNLGTEYLIPPIPTIKGTTDPVDWVTEYVAERQPFKLFIINTEEQNSVLLEGEEPRNISLQPKQIVQVMLTDSQAFKTLKADKPVAVLFGHTCALRYNCTCGQLSTMLPPATEETQKYYIPPDLAMDAEDETFVLLSEEESTEVKAFDLNSPLVEAKGSAILYRPGLLLTLISEADFGSCFIINSIHGVENYAVIIVHKDSKDDVHLGHQSLASQDWQELKGQEYVSTKVLLGPEKNIIWHASSTMAVYFVGNNEGTLYGNPAPIVSKIPDFRGCAITPEVVEVGDVADGWRESLVYCKNQTLELVSFPERRHQTQVYNRVMQAKSDGLQDVWIGMRRSSQTGQWYWLNKEPVNDTNWAEGEPGKVQDGQCAMMTVEKGKDFGWRDEHCCKQAHPVCYRSPTFIPL